jgi:ABC-2 type transport system ATP-binding protein
VVISRGIGVADQVGRLEVRNLCKRFADRLAVDHLSFIAEAGNILGVLGPNGAGKSTTFLTLSGLLRPDSGEIFLDGAPLHEDRGRTIALIPETPEVIPMLSVWEHLIYVAKLNRLDSGWEERARALMTRLGLDPYQHTLGHALSKGLRQRTLIAATVLLDSPVLLLDEPMIGLDPRAQRELREVLLELRNRGRIILVSTHMLSIAEEMCDQLIIIKAGQSIAYGSIADLRTAHGDSIESLFMEMTDTTVSST